METKDTIEWVQNFHREQGICTLCNYSGSKCWITYWRDYLEYQLTEFEWVCPSCGESHVKKDMDLTCDHCGFHYECQ
jgi:predicted RNA-binding Zn-ribbon protein involved in translation (DUF1610 family)